MKNQNTLLPLWVKLSDKKISELCYCSIRTASRIKRKIKDHCKVKEVRFKHFLIYFDEID